MLLITSTRQHKYPWVCITSSKQKCTLLTVGCLSRGVGGVGEPEHVASSWEWDSLRKPLPITAPTALWACLQPNSLSENATFKSAIFGWFPEDFCGWCKWKLHCYYSFIIHSIMVICGQPICQQCYVFVRTEWQRTVVFSFGKRNLYLILQCSSYFPLTFLLEQVLFSQGMTKASFKDMLNSCKKTKQQ